MELPLGKELIVRISPETAAKNNQASSDAFMCAAIDKYRARAGASPYGAKLWTLEIAGDGFEFARRDLLIRDGQKTSQRQGWRA